ncbi:MAG: hypothetical protein Q9166_005123 [cf. Caloplaca sp. 2 TL-2023]
MPLIRKRRSQQAEPPPSPPPQRRRASPPASDVSSVDEAYDGGAAVDEETQGAGSSHEQMVKKLVRLALASEYSRQPIRRTDITAKVMAPNTGRQFKTVFEEANHQLRSTFGCQMTELPQKEKITVSQKRAAQRSQTQNTLSSSTKSYILTSTIPSALRNPSILPPPSVPTSASESAYTGLYTFILSLIYLSPGHTIPESRLEKHLKRMNADNYVLSGEKTEKVLKRMEKEGYIVKVRERDGGGEESVDFVVGPRGKAEVGEVGVAGCVRKVFGKIGMEREELERRLVRSLGEVVQMKARRDEDSQGDGETQGNAGGEREGEPEQGEEVTGNGGRIRSARGKKSTQKTRATPRRGRSALVEEEADDDDDDEDDEDEEEEDQDEDEDESPLVSNALLASRRDYLESRHITSAQNTYHGARRHMTAMTKAGSFISSPFYQHVVNAHLRHLDEFRNDFELLLMFLNLLRLTNAINIELSMRRGRPSSNNIPQHATVTITCSNILPGVCCSAASEYGANHVEFKHLTAFDVAALWIADHHYYDYAYPDEIIRGCSARVFTSKPGPGIWAWNIYEAPTASGASYITMPRVLPTDEKAKGWVAIEGLLGLVWGGGEWFVGECAKRLVSVGGGSGGATGGQVRRDIRLARKGNVYARPPLKVVFPDIVEFECRRLD